MNTQTNDTAVTLEETIDRALVSLANDDPATDDYARVVDQLAKLYKMKETENNLYIKLKELEFKNDELHTADQQKTTELDLKGEELSLKQKELDNFNRISKAQLATILANLAGIAVIMSHERTHIIVTKAFSLVSKLK